MSNWNGVKFRQNIVDPNKYNIKAPYSMKAKMVTFHNTDNEVSAWNEIAYMKSNNNQTSYHVAADESEIVQGLPFNRNGWHCGDGANGYGNRNTIGWEICRNYDRSRRTTNLIDPLKYMYTQAELNTIKAAPVLFEQLGLVATVNTVKKHQDWSGKNCPSKILNENRWKSFQAAVIHSYNQYMNKGAVSDTIHEVKKGDTLSAIAKAYEIQLSDIIKENGIKNPDILSIGQKITIPVKSEQAKPIAPPKKTAEQVAIEIANGQGGWGNNPERRRKLEAAGYNASQIQKRVNDIIEKRKKPAKPAKKSWREVAVEIANGTGNWGNNPERRQKLQAAGYDAAQVQAEVNRLASRSTGSTSSSTIRIGDKVTASRLFKDGYTKTPSRTSNVTGYVEAISNNWTNAYRLEKTKGRKNWLGFARRSDLRK